MTGPISRLRGLTASQSPATEADGVMSETLAETDGPTWYHDMTGQEQADHEATVERQYQEHVAREAEGWYAAQDTHEEDLRADADAENVAWLAQKEFEGVELDRANDEAAAAEAWSEYETPTDADEDVHSVE
jgi:hypothetical protein